MSTLPFVISWVFNIATMVALGYLVRALKRANAEIAALEWQNGCQEVRRAALIEQIQGLTEEE